MSHIGQDAYERACAFPPARFGPRLTGSVVTGYWLDDHRYFFCASAETGGTIGTPPAIANTHDGTITPVVTIERLMALISGHDDKAITPADLALASYDMPDGATLVVTLGGRAFHIAVPCTSSSEVTLTKVETPDSTPSVFSPDGRFAAFLKDHAVWVRNRENGTSRPLTPNGATDHAYGRMPESSTMPLTVQKYPLPDALWSPNSEWLVIGRIDERSLPDGSLTEHAPVGGGRAVTHTFKIASVDADLPTAELIAYHLPSGKMVTTGDRQIMVIGMSQIAFRQCWFAGGCLYFLDWGRFSNDVALVSLDLADGSTREVLRESVDEGWIEINSMVGAQPIVRVLAETNEVIWYSQADGRGHLYLHDLSTGACKNRITQGNWMVRDIVHVDAERRHLLLLASGFESDADPGTRHLCAIGLDGAGFETLEIEEGDVVAPPDPMTGIEQIKPFRPSYAPGGASPDGRHIVVQVGRADTASRTLLVALDSDRQIELARSNADILWKAPKPEPFEVLAADGVTKLYGALYFPTGFDPSRSYPLVDYIYPGPQLNFYTRRLASFISVTLQSVVEFGMVGMILETRGVPGRDRAFHQAGKGRLHEPQLSDHAAAIEQLCQRHSFLDQHRIGLFGQSGGGFAAARAMFEYPERFKAGVSICGNHDSRHYISHWIDKYGSRPGSAERDAQANTSVAHQLRGKLLLIHGDMDDNVSPAHTLALSAALIAAGKDFDQLIVPGANHGVFPADPFAVRKTWSFLARHLLDAELPEGSQLRWTPAEHGRGMALMTDRPS